MKVYALLTSCLILGATAARSQSPAVGGQSGAATSPSQVSPTPGAGASPSSNNQSQPGQSSTSPTLGAGASAQVNDPFLNRTNSLNSGTNLTGQAGSSQSGVGISGSQNGVGASGAIGGQNGAGISGSANAGGVAGSSTTGGSINESAGAATPPNPAIGGSAGTGTNSLGQTRSAGSISEASGAGTATSEERSFNQRLRAGLMADKADHGLSAQNLANIQIANHAGTIVLTGTVKNEGQKQAIESRLKKMDGVRSIDNQLTIGEKKDQDKDKDQDSRRESTTR